MRKTFLFILALCATMMAWGTEVTVTRTPTELGKIYGWNQSTTTYYSKFVLDGAITIDAGTNGKFMCNNSPQSWRLFQANNKGEFTISAAQGYIIKSIKLTYVNNTNGILSKSPISDRTTDVTPTGDRIASGTALENINAQSITLYVGSTKTSTTGDITISVTQFSVVYEYSGDALDENFVDKDGNGWTLVAANAATPEGMYYSWSTSRCRHNTTDAMDKLKDGTWGVAFNGTDATNGQYFKTESAEGGVKFISFYWNQCNADESGKTETLKLSVGDNFSETRSLVGVKSSATGTDSRQKDLLFAAAPQVKTNAALKIERTAGNRCTFGPITIVPYLRYTQKSDELIILASEAEATYKNDAIINNTGVTIKAEQTDIEFSIIEGNDNSIASVAEDGTVTATASGTITVQAKWENVTTTYTLNITKNTLPVPQVSFADGETVEKDMNTIGYVNTLTRDGDGAVSYESSDETVAEVSNEGVITITGEGVTTITAKVTACATYAAAEASYELTITDPEDEAIVETFERNDAGSSTADREGTYYTWKITTGARTRATDKLFNETPSIWLASGGGAMETAIEGGVKRVGFLWNKFNKTANPISVSVIAGGVERTLTKEVQTGDDYNQNDPDLVFNSNFGIKSNTNLKIANPQNTTALQIGPIAITPYLLYTKKTDSKMLVEEGENTYINTELINNTGQELSAITFTTDNSNIAVMHENQAYPGTLKLVGGIGDVTVTAKWVPDATKQDEFVTTSYVLHVTNKEYSDAQFTTEGKVEHVLADGTFTNAVTFTKGEGPVSYFSDNEAVATVNTTGLVTIHGIGTAIISGHMDETDNYHAWNGSYTLVVHTGIADDQKLVEHFTQMPKGLISTEGGDEVEGDIDITWLAFNTRRGANDTIGGAGVQGNNIFAIGYVDSQEPIEGGIKYFSFNWKQWATEKGATLKLVATIDGVSYEDEYEVTDPDGKTTYEHFFFGQNVFAKKNVAIKLENKSYNTQSGEPLASNGRITFDAFEIVPYLYYTEKSKSFDVSDGGIPATYTHPIINNTDDDKIEYSIDGDELGIFSTTTGEITFDESKQGTATITASWEGVTTSYTLTVTRKQDVTVSFANPTEKAIVGKDYTLQEMTVSPESTGDQSYESSDNTVAAVVEGALQIKKAGVVTITGTVAETDVYKGASATYQLVIYPSEVAPNILVEDYKTATGGLASDVTNYKGNFATWKYRNSRSKTTDNLKEGTKGFMFSHTNGDNKASSYFETTLDGGIKAVYFDWRQFTKDDNGQNLIFQIKLDGTVQKSIEYTAADELVENIQSYSYAPEMKKNGVKLTFANNAKSADGKTDVTGRIMMGPLTIVPYLFYTTKEVEMIIPAGEESATYTNDELIDNRDDAVDISYSVSEGASVNNEGTVTVSAAGEYTVTATWGDVSTTYTLKVTKAAEPDFVRNDLSVGQLITVCWENEIASVEGGTFYEILNGNISEITFQEVALPIAAGTPVIFESDGTDMKVNYGEGTYEGALNESIEIGAFVGLVRNAEIDNVEIEQGNILINNGQLRQVGEYCVLTKGHAYIKTSALSSVNNAPRMGARTIRLYNPDAAPTNLNGLNGTVKPMKVLRDGQLYIIRDTKTYNAQGIEVQ